MKTGRPKTENIKNIYSLRLTETDKNKITNEIGEGSFTVGVEKMLSLYGRFEHIERKMSEKLRNHANGFAFAVDSMERAKHEGNEEIYKKFTKSCLVIADDILRIYGELGDDANKGLLKSLFNNQKYTKYIESEIKKREKAASLHTANA